MEIGSARKVDVIEPQYTDFCFVEVHSRRILSTHLAVFTMTGFTEVNIPQKSSCCRQSLPDENFRKLFKNGKSSIFLLFRHVCLAEMQWTAVVAPLFRCVKSPQTFL